MLDMTPALKSVLCALHLHGDASTYSRAQTFAETLDIVRRAPCICRIRCIVDVCRTYIRSSACAVADISQLWPLS